MRWRRKDLENEILAQKAKACELEMALTNICFWTPATPEEASATAAKGLEAAKAAYKRVVLRTPR